jgi:RNA polymerase sigma factor (sigma-70 family)
MIDTNAAFADLIEQARSGSDEAMRAIVERYEPHIFRAVRRKLVREIRSKFDSQDFVQAVWKSFVQNRERLLQVNQPENLIGLLAQMAHHKVIEEVRRRTKTQKFDVRRESPWPEHAEPAPQPPARTATPSKVAMARECWQQLGDQQPSFYREIARLRMRGETYQEIARKLDISERTVRRVLERLHRETES